jgi:cell shape-determining protein MreD
LGYSAAGFCLIALVVERFRSTVFVFRAVTHVVIGSVCSVASTLWLALLLTQDGLIDPSPGWLARKVVGAAVLGAVAVPIAFRCAEALDVRLGLVEDPTP